MSKIQNFKDELLSEQEEQAYVTTAFEQLYAERLDQQLRKHGIYRTRKQLYLRWAAGLAAAAAAVFLVFWIGFNPAQNTLQGLVQSHLANARTDYIREVRKAANDTAVPEQWDIVMPLFKEGKYKEAAAIFEKMPTPSMIAAPEKRNFYAGLCYLLQSPPDLVNAAAHLERATQLAKDPRDAQWLLALTYIKTGDTEKASALLNQLNNEEGSFRKKDVKEILKALSIK